MREDGKGIEAFLCYRTSVNTSRLLCVLYSAMSAWMFDAPLQLRGIVQQSFQLLLSLRLSTCASAAPTTRAWHEKPFERSYYTQWNLYDNCAAGNINYTFSPFSFSSHLLLGSTCQVGHNEPGALLRHAVFKTALFPSALPELIVH